MKFIKDSIDQWQLVVDSENSYTPVGVTPPAPGYPSPNPSWTLNAGEGRSLPSRLVQKSG